MKNIFEKERKLSDSPNAIEMYKQKGYKLDEETKEYFIFRKKYNFFIHIGLTIFGYWFGLLVLNMDFLGTILFIVYMFIGYIDYFKVIKDVDILEYTESISNTITNKPNATITTNGNEFNLTINNNKPKGSWFILVLWLILFFPIGIVYFFIRRWD